MVGGYEALVIYLGIAGFPDVQGRLREYGFSKPSNKDIQELIDFGLAEKKKSP